MTLEHAKERLAYYQAKPPYKTKDRGSFGWGEEIAFWQGEVDRLTADPVPAVNLLAELQARGMR